MSEELNLSVAKLYGGQDRNADLSAFAGALKWAIWDRTVKQGRPAANFRFTVEALNKFLKIAEQSLNAAPGFRQSLVIKQFNPNTKQWEFGSGDDKDLTGEIIIYKDEQGVYGVEFRKAQISFDFPMRGSDAITMSGETVTPTSKSRDVMETLIYQIKKKTGPCMVLSDKKRSFPKGGGGGNRPAGGNNYNQQPAQNNNPPSEAF